MNVISSVLSIAAVVAQPYTQYNPYPAPQYNYNPYPPQQYYPYNYPQQPQIPPAQPQYYPYPQQPQAPATPTPPQQPGVGQPQAPSVPTPPIPGQPGYGIPPIPPQQPGFGGMGMGMLQSFQQLKCEFNQCRNQRITLSPSQNFKLECIEPGQCDGMVLTLNVGIDPMDPSSGVAQIDSLTFKTPTRGATVNINAMAGEIVELDYIRCEVPMSCNGLTVNAGLGVEVHNVQVDCSDVASCINCKVNNMDCNMLSMQNGNNGMFNNGIYPGMPGMGFNVEPVYPQQPPQQYNPYGPPQQPQGQGPQTNPSIPSGPQAPPQPVLNNPQIPAGPAAI